MSQTRAQAIAEGEKTYFTGNPCPHGHIAERRTKDGFCVECRKKHQLTYMKIYQRSYYKTYKRKDDRKQYFKEYDKQRDLLKKYARRKLNNFLAKGKIIKQECLKCGASNTEAHHPDYSKPLEIIWLCRIHHAEIHHPLI